MRYTPLVSFRPSDWRCRERRTTRLIKRGIMRILQCMASIDPRKGGPSSASRALSAALAAQGHTVTLVAHNDGRGVGRVERLDGYEVRTFPLTFRRWQFSFRYLAWVRQNLRSYDAVLITSLFLGHSFFVPRIARKSGVPFAIRPHGSLNEADLARRGGLKRLYIRLIELQSLKDARFVFCTSEAEARQARAFARLRCVVIPLGVSLPSLDSGHQKRTRDQVLFLGRLTRKKGVDILIAAVAHIRSLGVSVHLEIAGPDDEGLAALYRQEATRLGIAKSVQFTGFANPSRRAAALARSGVFVLPSADENFGIAVAEALAAGLPVVVTPGVSHAAMVQASRVGVVCERTPLEVAAAILTVMRLPEIEYDAMCVRAADVARTSFDWDRTALSLVSAYVLGAGAEGSP